MIRILIIVTIFLAFALGIAICLSNAQIVTFNYIAGVIQLPLIVLNLHTPGAIARAINKPLADLSFAASRIREGEFDSRLDENTFTSEIRQVNMGFNRMARELARVEEDRAVMLAGISHDLRTPLARLRLETEMSVSDEEAKRNMAADIDQLDAIIDKFMDYARPGETELHPVHVAQLIDREAAVFRDPSQIKVVSRVPLGFRRTAKPGQWRPLPSRASAGWRPP